MNGNITGALIKASRILCVLVCILLTVLLLGWMIGTRNSTGNELHAQAADEEIIDKFDMFVVNTVSDALDGILAVEKVYWLSDEDMVAPVPDPDNFGTATDPRELEQVLEAARDLLGGQETFFTLDTQILEGSKIKYYLDDTIFAVTWKETSGLTVLTFSEVRIAHPSQFRRFLSGGEYGSKVRYKTTEMSRSVNAVTAANGDYYDYRPFGIVVNNGTVYRTGDEKLDTCFIDSKGDLLFVPKGSLPDKASLEAYIEENDVRFSLSFGPILLEDGEVRVPGRYAVGEIDKSFSRAALCQLDQCHYLMVTANKEPYYYDPPNLYELAEILRDMGITRAYTLDGGQTATIVTGGELMNSVDYGGERRISDIIYFATAMPEE